MTKIMLILPSATYRAPTFLAAAEALGVEVVTGSDATQALAASMGDRFLQLPLHEPDDAASRIVEFSSSRHLDAIVGVDDGGILVAALASERLGLSHNPPEAVRATRDKATMRPLLARAGVSQPAFVVVSETTRGALVDAVLRASSQLTYPVVVKPPGLSGSRGVIRADNDEEARRAVVRICDILESASEPTTTLLVESFVKGQEVALEAILTDGHLEVLGLFDKPDPLDGPFFEETIYITPSRHRPELQDAVAKAIGQACDALGLKEGPVHGEARIDPDRGDVVVLEVAGRTIGGRCSTVLQFATGASLEEIVLSHALGRRWDNMATATGAGGVMMLPIPRSGRLVAVRGETKARSVPGVVGLEISIPIGHLIDALPEGDRYLGFLFARGDTPEFVESAIRRAHAMLEVVIEDRDPEEPSPEEPSPEEPSPEELD